MTVRVTREAEAQIELYGAFSGQLAGNGKKELTFTPTENYLIMVVKNSLSKVQLEQGAFKTSYIPTTTAAKTRSADVATIDVDQFGYNYSNVVGTFFVEFETFATTGTTRALAATLGTDRAADINLSPATSRIDVYSNHTVSDLYSLSPYSSEVNKIAAAMKENDAAACANGGTVDTDASTTSPIIASSLEIGRYFTTGYLNGHIKSLKYYPRRLTNAQLQELTS